MQTLAKAGEPDQRWHEKEAMEWSFLAKKGNLHNVYIQAHTCIDISMEISDSMHSLASGSDFVFTHLLEIQNSFYTNRCVSRRGDGYVFDDSRFESWDIDF